MNDFLGWRTSAKTAQRYVDSINRFLSSDDNFNNFRNNNDGYSPILEHLTHRDGSIYANYIKSNYPHLLDLVDKLKLNDTVGNPILFDYNGFGKINPTTLRYIKFLGDIQNRFGDLNGYNLVEIGGGYGGLVRVLNSLYSFDSIKLFDLPPALKLQSRYLNKFNISVETYTHNDDIEIKQKTLVISNYAWCECDQKTRDVYIEKIIKKCDLTYMVVYGIDVENELMTLDGDKFLDSDILNGAPIYTNKK
jgi:putative sugar O-methyltransferase